MGKETEKDKVLVVYYSKGGNTRIVAKKVAERLDADVDEIKWDNTSAGKAIFAADPREYDFIIVGTPVNGFSPSKPVADYLARNSGKFPRLATFLTYSLWPAGTLRRMGELASVTPVASTTFKSRDIKLNRIDDSVDAYIHSLKRS